MTKTANINNGTTIPNINDNPDMRWKASKDPKEEILAILEKENPALQNTEWLTEKEKNLYNELDKAYTIFGNLPPKWEGIFQKLKEKINMNTYEKIEWLWKFSNWIFVFNDGIKKHDGNRKYKW